MLPIHSLALIALALPVAAAPNQSPATIIDINQDVIFQQPAKVDAGHHYWFLSGVDEGYYLSGYSLPFLSAGNSWVVRSWTPDFGVELFTTDGTASGIQLLKDIGPGPSDSNPFHLTAVGNEVWFMVSHPEPALWRTDGSSTGTTQIASIPLIDPESGHPLDHTAPITLGNKLLFLSAAPGQGVELWVSDGTSSGTTLLVDALPGPGHGRPHALTLNAAGDRALFLAGNNTANFALWETDGTPLGTQVIRSFAVPPGADGKPTKNMARFGSKIFFRGSDLLHGSELWETDGTTAGTKLVHDITPGPDSTQEMFDDAAEFNGLLYFVANEETFGSELWVTDGTSGGTHITGDGNLYSGSSHPRSLTVFGNHLYYVAYYKQGGSGQTGTTLFRASNGSSTPFFLPSPQGIKVLADPSQLLVNTGLLHFVANGGNSGMELFATNGTLAGTGMVANIAPGSSGSYPRNLTPIGANRFMFTTGGLDQGADLQTWTSTGAPAGTHLTYSIQPNALTEDSAPDHYISLNGTTALMRARVQGGHKLHQYDSQTGLAGPLFSSGFDSPTIGGAITKAWVGTRQLAFFVGTSTANGHGLWSSDGTEAGTVFLKPLESSPTYTLHSSGSGLIMAAHAAGASMPKLTFSDGTVAGTVVLGSIKASLNKPMATVNGVTFFVGGKAAFGQELCATDGSPDSAHIVFDIKPGPQSSNINGLTAFRDHVVFSAHNNLSGRELWASDGTKAGTFMVADILAGSGSSNPENFFVLGGTLYFAASTPANGTELWKSDLTVAGTTLVKDINPGAPSSDPLFMVELNGELIFRADDGSGGDLWRSDGSPVGTIVFADTNSNPSNLISAGDGIVFQDYDFSTGTGLTLRYADGSTTPTLMVNFKDYTSVPFGATEFVWVGGQLLAPTDNAAYGKELLVISLPLAKSLDLGISGSGAQLSTTAPVLGSNITINCVDVPLSTFGIIAVSAPVSTPSASLTQTGSASWLDLATASPFTSFAGPNYQGTFAVPATPSLAGVQINMQAWFFGPAVFPATTSNGLALRLGH